MFVLKLSDLQKKTEYIRNISIKDSLILYLWGKSYTNFTFGSVYMCNKILLVRNPPLIHEFLTFNILVVLKLYQK